MSTRPYSFKYELIVNGANQEEARAFAAEQTQELLGSPSIVRPFIADVREVEGYTVTEPEWAILVHACLKVGLSELYRKAMAMEASGALGQEAKDWAEMSTSKVDDMLAKAIHDALQSRATKP